jgi:hypothetical protein
MLSSKCKLALVTKCSQRREKFKLKLKNYFLAVTTKNVISQSGTFSHFLTQKTDSREKLNIIFSNIPRDLSVI